MAAVHWLTETGDVEPEPVCAVDYSDEGEAVEFAHHLYRSVHGFACSRQGFVIANDNGGALYTWRWTSGAPVEASDAEQTDAEETDAEETATASRSSSDESSKPAGAPVLESRGLAEIFGAGVSAVQRRVARFGSTDLVRRLKRGHNPTANAKNRAAKLRALLRHVPPIWRRLTRWERPMEPAVRAERWFDRA